MNDSERMQQLLLGLKMNAETLGKSIGKRKGDVIRNVLNGANGISHKLAYSITQAYPNVSFEWLMTGEGEVFLKEEGEKKSIPRFNNCPVCQEKERNIGLLLDRIEEQKKTIASQEKCIEMLTLLGAKKPPLSNQEENLNSG